MTAPEPWLRGPVPGVPDELQPAAHALLQAREDLPRAAAGLAPTELWMRPGGAASVGFHLRHLAGSLDRLFTYARGESLSPAQLAALAAEQSPGDPPPDAATLLA
ncbi:MAG TPA: DinB family protein, partial [Gemmatimonadaceae bacterium]|nr:DinB family protein [Gemmatimonadaceae bacterium]